MYSFLEDNFLKSAEGKIENLTLLMFVKEVKSIMRYLNVS